MKKKDIVGRDERFNRSAQSELKDDEAQNLRFNEEENSYEIDIEPIDEEYQHLNPYDTAADNGDDINSDYDESNPYIGKEYDKDASLETDIPNLGMHLTSEESFKLNENDKDLSRTEEDNRRDLDLEGYPKFEK
jgi:hypothetical protein